MLELTLDASGFSGEKFDEFADGHSRRKSVRIHDHIRHDPILRERHIFLHGRKDGIELINMPGKEL